MASNTAAAAWLLPRLALVSPGAPPPGLTVEGLAMLLEHAPWSYAPGWAESVAAWLLPRLGSVSPGAPAAALLAARAVVEAFDGWVHHGPDSLLDTTAQAFTTLEHVIGALRAALAVAQP